MKLFRVVIALSLLLICNACSENDIITESTTKENELEIVTSIFKTKNTTENDPSALAATEGTPIGAILGSNLPGSSTMGVYVSGRADGFTHYGNTSTGNLRWKNSTNGWMHVDANDQPQSFKLNSNPAHLFGYYPHNPSITASATNIPVRAGYTDYMYGKEGAQSSNANKNMVMSHAMSILSFSFRNTGNTGNCMLQGIKLKNLPVSGSMDLITGKITPDASTGEVNLAAYESTSKYNPQTPDGSIGFATEYTFKMQPVGTVNPSGSTYGEKMGAFHAIVFPSDNPGNYQIDIKVDGKIKTISFSAANNSLKWEAGKRYIYNIAMNYDGMPSIQLNAVISDYEDKGSIEEVFGNNITIETPDGLAKIERPTWKNQSGYSRSFEISKTELTNINWYDASGRANNGNTIQFTGCHIYSEEDGKQNWRIPTYKEMELIVKSQNNLAGPLPVIGSYWTSGGKATISISNTAYSITQTSKENEYNKLKARCVRDTYQP